MEVHSYVQKLQTLLLLLKRSIKCRFVLKSGPGFVWCGCGLKVIQNSGSPGAAPTVILRGGTNLDGTGSPLVVVDGQLRDSMSDINPEDIESMDVLKDAVLRLFTVLVPAMVLF